MLKLGWKWSETDTFRKYFEHRTGCAIELLVGNEDLGGMKGDTGVWLALLLG